MVLVQGWKFSSFLADRLPQWSRVSHGERQGGREEGGGRGETMRVWSVF